MALLRRAGKKAAIAEKKAEKIIDKLIKGSIPEYLSSLTRTREYRIENCIKYDLGNGYRLITCKHGDRLFILFVGTHDECHRWLENNKGWQPVSADPRGNCLSVKPEVPKDTENRYADEREPEDDPEYFDEKLLRIVFRGLCGE